MASRSICALANRECPKTGDPSARVYCPHWKTAIPETERDGSGRLIATYMYTGCQVPKLVEYMIAMTAEADHAHAASNQARDSANEVKNHLIMAENSLKGAVLAPLLESFSIKRDQIPASAQQAKCLPSPAELSEEN